MNRFLSMVYCAWVCIWRSFIVSRKGKKGKVSRRFTTKYLHRGGVDILKSVRATYQASFDPDFKIDHSNPVIFMSNHLSLFDLPLIVATIPGSIRVVIKKELIKVPFLGKAALASEQVIVDRYNFSQNKETFYKTAQEKLKSGILLWVFPEGTRSRTGELLPFKLGVFRLAKEINAQIIPVGIKGTNSILPAGNLLPNLYQNIHLSVGKPINTCLLKINQSIEKLSEEVRLAILSLIDT